MGYGKKAVGVLLLKISSNNACVIEKKGSNGCLRFQKLYSE